MCLTCHGRSTPYPHAEAGHAPPDCAGCHGFNGAPSADHAVVENTGCKDCHGNVGHVPSFNAPGDCVKCHSQPPQP
jgi:hypothetical protein